MDKTKVDIIFNPTTHNTGVYYSGEVVSGKLTLQLYKTKEVKAIYLKIFGVAHSEWGEQRGQYRQTFIGKEKYVTSLTYFHGSENNTGPITIEPGTHNYDFHCELPNEIPTSFKKEYGYVRYSVRLCIERPRWPKKEYTFNFNVIKRITLDSLLLKEPISKITSTDFRTRVFSRSDPLQMTILVPRSGYISGEQILVSLNIVNNSPKHIHRFKIGLYLEIAHFDTGKKHEKIYEEKLVFIITPGCPAGESANYQRDLLIPTTMPTDITSSRIHQIYYLIKVKGKVDAGHFDPVMSIPIFIGTHKLNENEILDSKLLNELQQSYTDNNAVELQAKNNNLPTYEEAMGSSSANFSGKSDIQENEKI